MAYTPSRERPTYVVAKKETTEGTDAAPVGGTDDLISINAPNPMQAQFDQVQYRPHSVSFTQRKDLTTVELWQFDTEFWMCGSASNGVSAVNGFAAQEALLLAAGNQETIVAATSLTFQPATIAQLGAFSAVSPKCGSATVWASDGTYLRKAPGAWGNMVITGAPTTGVVAKFTGMGKYNAPTAAGIGGWVGDALTRPVFKGVTATITPAGGSAYIPVLKSFTFDMGADIQRVTDANATTGLNRILYADRLPTLEVVIGLDDDTASNLTYINLLANWDAGTTHALTWKAGVGAGNVMTFTFPQAQIKSVADGIDTGLRTATIKYKLQHSTNEAEWTLGYAAV
jgi:hypothetical protein